MVTYAVRIIMSW